MILEHIVTLSVLCGCKALVQGSKGWRRERILEMKLRRALEVNIMDEISSREIKKRGIKRGKLHKKSRLNYFQVVWNTLQMDNRIGTGEEVNGIQNYVSKR